MNRRGFLGSMLALGAAPAVVRAEILMPVRSIVTPLSDCELFQVFQWDEEPDFRPCGIINRK